MSQVFAEELRRRFSAHIALKVAGLGLFVATVLLIYFQTLDHPRHPVHVMPQWWVDRALPYQPWTLGIYFSLWGYISLPPVLMASPRELVRYAGIAGFVAAVGLSIYARWPTAVAVRGPGFLGRLDPGGNACPSFHAAFDVLTSVVLHRLLRTVEAPRFWRVLNIVWCVAILYSTLATKQHVVIDLLAGAGLGGMAGQFFSSSRSNAPG